MHLFNIFWPIPPWRWLSQGQVVGGGRRLFLACSSGRCNQGATKVQPRCSQVLRLFSFSSTLLSEKLFWHGWSGMICFLITNVIVNLWSALLTCETWLRPTNTLWRLSQEGRWTRRATGQNFKSQIWNVIQVCLRSVLHGSYLPSSFHQTWQTPRDRQHRSHHCVGHQGGEKSEYLGRKPIGFRICGSSLKRWTTAPWCWWPETSLHTIWLSNPSLEISFAAAWQVLTFAHFTFN